MSLQIPRQSEWLSKNLVSKFLILESSAPNTPIDDIDMSMCSPSYGDAPLLTSSV